MYPCSKKWALSPSLGVFCPRPFLSAQGFFPALKARAFFFFSYYSVSASFPSFGKEGMQNNPGSSVLWHSLISHIVQKLCHLSQQHSQPFSHAGSISSLVSLQVLSSLCCFCFPFLYLAYSHIFHLMEILPSVFRPQWRYMLFVKQPLQLLSFNSSLLKIQPLTFIPGRIAAAKSCQIHMLKFCIPCTWK